MTIDLFQDEEKEIIIPVNKKQIRFNAIQFGGEATPAICILVFNTSEYVDFTQSEYSKLKQYYPVHQNNIFPVIPNSSIKISIKGNKIDGQQKFRLEFDLS